MHAALDPDIVGTNNLITTLRGKYNYTVVCYSLNRWCNHMHEDYNKSGVYNLPE